MKPFRENIEPDQEGSFRVMRFTPPAFTYGWHFHPEIELTYIVAGEGKRLVGDDIANFTPGDLCLLGPNLPHAWLTDMDLVTPDSRSESIVIQFLPDCFGPGVFDRPETRSIARLLQQAERGLQFAGDVRDRVARMMEEMVGQPSFRRMMTLLETLNVLAEADDGEPLSSLGFAPPVSDSDQRRIDAVTRFIIEHLIEPLRLEDAADVAHLSASAFSRFFRRATGKSFVRYVNELRVARACRLLTETEHSITSIAFESGFGNLANFNRRFREIKQLRPREFRSHFTQGNA